MDGGPAQRRRSVPPPGIVDAGEAGAGARQEYERRKAAREARIRRNHPHTAWLRLAFGKAPAHETAWASGAEGERKVADSLMRRCGEEVRFLHDRKVPGSRANIDHLAIAPSGVWVIDAKNYSERLAVKVRRGELWIGGRRRTKLVDGVERQIAAVNAAVAAIDPTAPVRGAFCFVEGGLPTFRTLTVRGIPLLWPRRMAKRINAEGPLLPEQIALLHRELAVALPAAAAP